MPKEYDQCEGKKADKSRCKNVKKDGSNLCRMCEQAAAKKAALKAEKKSKEAAAKEAGMFDPAPRAEAVSTSAAVAAAPATGVSSAIAAAGLKASGKSAAMSKSKEVQDWLCGGAKEFPPWPRTVYPPEAPSLKPVAALSDEEFEKLPFPTGEQFGITKKMMKEVWNTQEPGAHYGILFPHSVELIESMGAAWLTKAFHLAGTLPEDNSVTELKKVIVLSSDPTKGEALGGAAIKVMLIVEYAKPHADLHTRLFIKIPTSYVAIDPERYKNRMGMDEYEIFFSRLVEPALTGVGCPKLYYGDYCRKNGNSIMIFEALQFASEWKPFSEYKLFEVHPMMDKNKDWQVTEHGRKNYPALGRAMGRMHAAYHKGELGAKEKLARIFPGLDGGIMHRWSQGWPLPEVTGGDEGFLNWLKSESERTTNAVQSMVLMGVDFTLNVCPQLFPSELKDKTWLKRFVKEATHVGQYETEIGMFMNHDPEMFCLAHGNIQIDNAFYYNNSDGEVEAGLLDFGGMSHSNPVNALARNWIAAEPEVMDQVDESILDGYIEELEKCGGPKLDRHKVFQMARLTQADFAFSMAANLVMLYATHPKRNPIWKEFKDRWDERVEGVFLTRIFTANWRNMMLLWRSEKRNPYKAFLQWLEENPWLPKKPPVPEPAAGSPV